MSSLNHNLTFVIDFDKVSNDLYKTIKLSSIMSQKNSNHSGNLVYVLGVVGAAIHFISQSTGFWMGVIGFFKALAWPAFLVYQAFRFFAT